MQSYRSSLSKYKKAKQQEKDRQRIGLSRNSVAIGRSKSTMQKHNYHCQHQVPTDPAKFDALLHELVSIGKRLPSKLKKIRQVLDELALVKEITLLQLHALKSQNRRDHKESVEKICHHFGDISKAACEYDVPEKTLRQLCKPIPEPQVEEDTTKKMKASNEMAQKFWLEGHISVPDPSVRPCKKRFLINNIEDTYKMYNENCNNKGIKPVLRTTFNRL